MLPKKYNFNESEKKWQDYWQSEKIYKFNPNNKKTIYSIDTPPPTASGKIHLGHIYSYTQAEFMARFKRMTGYNVFYPFGFDNNGLPTEQLVEKETGTRGTNMSREEFNKICLQVVKKYEDVYRKTYIRAGLSCDWDSTYSTISPEVQKIAQQSFLELYKQGNLHHGMRDALWCTECQTSIAQAELEDAELPTVFYYMTWNLSDGSGKVEIATTRPEMLSACVCVFVNPSDKRYKKLVNKKVVVPLYNFEVEILTDELVSMDKGSGVVMCCTYGDQTDLAWQKKHNLPYKQCINDFGKMTSLAGKYEGLKVTAARAAIAQDLESNGFILKKDEFVHHVSVHERCKKSAMEIVLKKQWFIKILENQNKFLELGDKVEWRPAFRKSAYTDWVKNLNRDWCISRQRFYGIPFPVWYCKNCGEVILANAKSLPVNPLSDTPVNPCKCGCNDFMPESDVMDTWFTSSLTPQINCKWNISNTTYKKMMPMDLRPNAREIIRTWDFYTIVKSWYHSKTIPWKNVMISGWVLADKDQKISKSQNNSKMDPDYAFNVLSADVVRYWAASGSLGTDLILKEDAFKIGARLTKKIWNATKFVLMFLESYKYKTTLKKLLDNKIKLYPIDEWIILSYNEMLAKMKLFMEKCEVGFAMETLEKFFWNFCDNYIELVKNRLYKPEIFGKEAKESAQYTCRNVLLGLIKCFAIFMPHITEEIYQGAFITEEKTKSVHLCQLNEINLKANKKLLKLGDEICEIVSKIRQFKSENNLSLKEELTSVEIVGYSPLNKLILTDIKAVGSIKKIKCVKSETKTINIVK